MKPQTVPAKPTDLPQLLEQILACRICVDEPIGAALPHPPRPVLQAHPAARICISGQAPGTRVHATGIPFNDPSGDRLREWTQLDRSRFYDERLIAIVPMGFCFPGLAAGGSDLPPRKECRAHWHDNLYAHLPNLRLILAIGSYAQAYHLGNAAKRSVTETVGNWQAIGAASQASGGPFIIPLPHPSWRNTGWLKRNSWFAEELLPVLRAEVAAQLADVS